MTEVVAQFREKERNFRAEIRMIRALTRLRELTDNLIAMLKFNKVLPLSMARNHYRVISLSLKFHLSKEIIQES